MVEREKREKAYTYGSGGFVEKIKGKDKIQGVDKAEKGANRMAEEITRTVVPFNIYGHVWPECLDSIIQHQPF